MNNEEAVRVLKVIKEHPSMAVYYLHPDEYEALDLAIKSLEERPQGEWLFSRCNKCGIYYNGVYRNFCPECGADMRKRSDE